MYEYTLMSATEKDATPVNKKKQTINETKLHENTINDTSKSLRKSLESHEKLICTSMKSA